MQETNQDAAENDATIDYTYNPNYQSVAVNMYERNEDLGTNGDSVNVLSATADKIPASVQTVHMWGKISSPMVTMWLW